MRFVYFFVFTVAFLASLNSSSAQQISVVAGAVSDGRLATETDLNPDAFAVTSDGTIYVASYGYLRKIDRTSGIVTKKITYSGGMVDMAAGPAGSVFYSGGLIVYKLDAAGNQTKIAGNTPAGNSGNGGPAVNALFSRIAGIAVDSNGDLYISDLQNHDIRKVTASTGIITKIAGTGSEISSGNNGLAIDAGMNPGRLVLDGSGNLLFVDTNNETVRKINLATGIVTAVVNGGSGYSGDGGPAIDAKVFMPSDLLITGGVLYIMESVSRIRQVNLTTGIITTFAGANGTSGYTPDGAAVNSGTFQMRDFGVDQNGDLLINDNEKIRKIASGVVNTLYGTGAFYGDGGLATKATLRHSRGIAVASNGDVYLSDLANARIRKIDHSTNIISTIAGTGSFESPTGNNIPALSENIRPWGLVLDSDGNLIFSDYGNNLIRKVDLSNGNITTIAGTGTYGDSGDGGPALSAQLKTPAGLTIDSDGNLFFYSESGLTIHKYNKASGNVTKIAGNGAYGDGGDGGSALAAQFKSEVSLAVGPDHNLYVSDWQNRSIRMIDQSGIITKVAGIAPTSWPVDGGPLVSADLRQIRAINFDHNGSLIFNTYVHLMRVKMGSTTMNAIAGNGNFGQELSDGHALSVDLPEITAITVLPNNDLLFSTLRGQLVRLTFLNLTQSLTFNPIPDRTFGDAPFTINTSIASASSGLPVTFTSSDPSIASISGNVITIKRVGTVNITASQPGNNDYSAATPLVQPFTIKKSNANVVTINSPNRGNVGTSISLSAVNSKSSGVISYSIENGTGTASIDGNKLTLLTPGGLTVTATAADDGYYTLSSTSFPVLVVKPQTTASFTSLSVGNAGTSIELAIDKGQSTGTVSFSVENISGTASLTGSTLSLLSAGTVRVKAVITGDSNFEDSQVSQLIFINNSDGSMVLQKPKIVGTATLGGANNVGTIFQMDANLTNPVVLKDFTETTSGYSPGARFDVLDNKIFGYTTDGTSRLNLLYEFDLSSKNYKVLHKHQLNEGTLAVFVLANPKSNKIYTRMRTDGNPDFSEGSLTEYNRTTDNLSVIFRVGEGMMDTGLRFGVIAENGQMFGTGSRFDLTGILASIDVGSGAFSVEHVFNNAIDGNSPTQLVEGPEKMLYGFGFGGPNNRLVFFKFNPFQRQFSIINTYPNGPDVTAVFNAITLGADGKFYGHTPTGGTYGQGGIISIDPSTGNIEFKAYQQRFIGTPLLLLPSGKLAGVFSADATKKPTLFEFDPVARTITEKMDFNGPVGDGVINMKFIKADQNIGFPSISKKFVGDPDFQLSALASSGLPVTYESSNAAVATITGKTIKIIGKGEATITAYQNGDPGYNKAQPVSRVLIVEDPPPIVKKQQSINFTKIDTKTIGDLDFTLSATATSSLAVQFAASNTNIAINGSTVKLIKAGRTSVKASQAGNAEYEPAVDVSQTFCVNPAKPVITVTDATNLILSSSSDIGNQWYLNGVAIAEGNLKTIKATTSGAYTVKTTVDDCTSVSSEVSTIVITGLEESAHRFITIYPNPISTEVVVEIGYSQRTSQITLTDMLGRVVLNKTVSAGTHTLDVSELSKGLYVVRVIEGEKSVSKTLVKR